MQLEGDDNGNVLKRTGFLTTLCILSFAGGGMEFLSNIILYLFHEPIKAILNQQGGEALFGVQMDFDLLLSVSPLFFLSQAIFSLMSVTGVALMWRLNKTGFHIYTIAQIVLLIIPKLFFSGIPFPWFELSVSFIFVYFYGKSLKIF